VNGSWQVDCPKGYFCPQGTTQPTKCNFLATCECTGGCKAPANFVSVPLLILIPLVAYLVWKGVKWYIKKQWKQRDDELAAARMRRSGASSRHSNSQRSLHVDEEGMAGAGVGAGVGAAPGVALEMGSPDMLQQALMSTPSSSMTFKDFTIDFHFQDLGLKLKKAPHKVVMKGVTGCIRHGRVTAVMGPSGACIVCCCCCRRVCMCSYFFFFFFSFFFFDYFLSCRLVFHAARLLTPFFHLCALCPCRAVHWCKQAPASLLS